jgi:23S rRNA pseudouridine2605 synthase
MSERIARHLARAGLCSRREAERWIAAGRVSIDGAVLTSPALNVGPDNVVRVDGEPVGPPQRRRLWLYHKPPGLLTTRADPRGRPTVFEMLPRDLPRVIAVGRLDLASEGLLLLTNDGDLAQRFAHPSYGLLRSYRARVHGRVEAAALAALGEGISVRGIAYGPIAVEIERANGANSWLTVALREGKNREIRRVLGHLGLEVNRLIRVSYGPFELGCLERGAVATVPEHLVDAALVAVPYPDGP